MDIKADQMIMNDATRYVCDKIAREWNIRALLNAKRAVEEGLPPSWLASILREPGEFPTLEGDACAKGADWLHIAEMLYMGALNERRRDEMEKVMWNCKAIADSSVDALRTVTSILERFISLLDPEDDSLGAGESGHVPVHCTSGRRP